MHICYHAKSACDGKNLRRSELLMFILPNQRAGPGFGVCKKLGRLCLLKDFIVCTVGETRRAAWLSFLQ